MATRRSNDTRRTTEQASTAGTAGTVRRAEPSAAAPRQPRRRSAASAQGTTTAVAAVAISADRRRAMIAEGAYLRAEQRGFIPGHEVDDWLAAEQEVDGLLSAGPGARQ